MKKQLPAMMLGIACIALLAAYINTNNTVKQLRREIAQLKQEANPDAGIAEMDEPSDAAVVAAVQTGSVAQTAQAVLEDVKQTRDRRMMENIARMMDNPTMNKVMEASQRGAVGALYTDLIEYLNLNDEETKYFMDLLMYRQMKQMDLAMKMMSGSLSDEEKQALQSEIEKAQETVREEMKKFLNNDKDFDEFEYYEKTMSERMMLSQMDKDLTGSGAELSDTTYRQLLGLMHDERENFEFTGNLQDQENADMSPERFSRENVQNFANDIEKLNSSICQQAQSLLTPEQYEAFVNSLKTFTEMQLAQLEMAAQMFGGDE